MRIFVFVLASSTLLFSACDPNRNQDVAEIGRLGDQAGDYELDPGPPLSEATVRRLNAVFDVELREEAARVLEDEGGNKLVYENNQTPEEMERLRYAALKVSNGSIEKLKEAIELGQTDWRDLLVAADFHLDSEAHESWMSELD